MFRFWRRVCALAEGLTPPEIFTISGMVALARIAVLAVMSPGIERILQNLQRYRKDRNRRGGSLQMVMYRVFAEPTFSLAGLFGVTLEQPKVHKVKK